VKAARQLELATVQAPGTLQAKLQAAEKTRVQTHKDLDAQVELDRKAIDDMRKVGPQPGPNVPWMGSSVPWT
jgi:hypothetical protein